VESVTGDGITAGFVGVLTTAGFVAFAAGDF